MAADSDIDIVAVMINGGKQLCEEAIWKWRSGKYGDNEAFIQDNIRRWTANKDRISYLGRMLKDAIKNTND